MKKETRGGSRKGAGAKPKFREHTKTVSFRCPVSKEKEFREVCNAKLSEWKIE